MKKTNKKLLRSILNQIESEWFAQPTRSKREIVREVFAEYGVKDEEKG